MFKGEHQWQRGQEDLCRSSRPHSERGHWTRGVNDNDGDDACDVNDNDDISKMVMTMMVIMVMMKIMKEVIPSHVILFGRNWFMLYQRIAIMMLMMLMLTNLSHVMTEVQTRKVWNWYILDQRFYTLDQRFVSCDTVPVKFSTGIYRIGQLWTLDQLDKTKMSMLCCCKMFESQCDRWFDIYKRGKYWGKNQRLMLLLQD